jgi:hypothetical protein
MTDFDPVQEDLIRVGAAYLHVAPTLNSMKIPDLYVPTSDLLVEGIPARVPLPVNGAGKFLGYTLGIDQGFNQEYKPKTRNGAISFTSVHVLKDNFEVSGNLIFNNSPVIYKYCLPMGINSTLTRSGGGFTSVRRIPLLVILTNRLNENSRICPCFYYHSGYFESVTLHSGRDFQGVQFVYKSGSGFNADTGCLLGAGGRNYTIFWFDTVDGVLVNPFNPFGEIIEDVLASEYFPIISPLMMI